MPAIPIIIYAVAAGASAYTARESMLQGKATKGARELAERTAQVASDKLLADQASAKELAAAQIENRKRALARNTTNETGALGVEEAGQTVKKALGQ